MKQPESYKPTFFDKHGADGGYRLKAIAFGIMVGGITFSAVMLVAAQVGVSMLSGTNFLGLAVVAALIGYGAARGAMGIAEGAGVAASVITAGSSSTPYEEQFSQEQALIMQRDYAGAAACFEHRIELAKENPDPRVCIAGADVYREYKLNPTRAAELYRMAQKIPSLTAGQDVYVANKLADLYLGPLQQPGKALVEFRRLIERYPNTRTAEQARMALTNIKQDMLSPGQ